VSLSMARLWQPNHSARKKMRLLAGAKTLHMAGVFVKFIVYTVCINLAKEKITNEYYSSLDK